MSWFRLDDQGAFHAKVVQAGNEAYGAWCRAGQWSCAQLTEGRVPRSTALAIAPLRVWKKLVEAKGTSEFGLVEAVGDDFLLHDFLDWNPSAAEELAKRAARSAAGRAGGIKSAASKASRIQAKPQSTAQAIASPFAQADGKQSSTPSPIPIPSPIPKNTSGVLSVDAGESSATTSETSKKKPLRPLPQDFAVSSAIELLCRSEALANPHEVLPDFRDWALGENVRKADWEATFRRWMRDDRTRRRYPLWAVPAPQLTLASKPPAPVGLEPSVPPTPEALAAMARLGLRRRDDIAAEVFAENAERGSNVRLRLPAGASAKLALTTPPSNDPQTGPRDESLVAAVGRQG